MHAASVPGSHVVLRATEEWQEPLVFDDLPMDFCRRDLFSYWKRPWKQLEQADSELNPSIS